MAIRRGYIKLVGAVLTVRGPGTCVGGTLAWHSLSQLDSSP